MTNTSKIYQLYLDDSGSRYPDRQPSDRQDGMDWFALGGILVERNQTTHALDSYKEFMQKWQLSAPLHSTKIRGQRGEFRWLRSDPSRSDAFYCDLTDLLMRIPVIGFACVVDRPGYNARYREKYGDQRWLMCKTAYAIVVERALKYTLSQSAKLEIFFEESGKTEDKSILNYHKQLKQLGPPFDTNTSSIYKGLSAEDFKVGLLGDARRLTKKSPFIQLADLYLYPMVKGGYDTKYDSYQKLMNNNRIIDAILQEEEIAQRGIKYSCFDSNKLKGPAIG